MHVSAHSVEVNGVLEIAGGGFRSLNEASCSKREREQDVDGRCNAWIERTNGLALGRWNGV